ncbi:(2Fe-2S)-binding protein [Bradyrhizobium sp. KBS0727]|uniref:(2Fe-2S)-binding protein n=1 Tax=unclassified Bradyrhizobium TaxID=2631580 RepID=UPI00110EED30|nr:MULTISPECIES: (2Fe-2S)-binding protein [unclassified Bradyrhizobium]QDW40572.1 (2Fe-2S)-binding protein [Bradyrhizobium sp. KBS0725]QDW47177.1 (2Fe-2S)-binding protein [Bradyrhizobium sp. KBS0727]
MKHSVSLAINGSVHEHDVEARLLLVHYIREKANLTGTHVGCDTSQCGACTVLLDGLAVKSCTIFAVQVAGKEIVTIEGLAKEDRLHPVQQAFKNNHGLQCGFCTPGFVMATIQLLQRYPDPTPEEIRHQLDGNICRCTGYRNIISAIQEAAQHIAPCDTESGSPREGLVLNQG